MLGSEHAFSVLKINTKVTDRYWDALITDEEALRDVKRPRPPANMGQNQDFDLGHCMDFCPESRGSQWTSLVPDLGNCQVPLTPAAILSAFLSLVVGKRPSTLGEVHTSLIKFSPAN